MFMWLKFLSSENFFSYIVINIVASIPTAFLHEQSEEGLETRLYKAALCKDINTLQSGYLQFIHVNINFNTLIFTQV